MITEVRQMLTDFGSFKKVNQLLKSNLDNVYLNILPKELTKAKKNIFHHLKLNKVAGQTFSGRIRVTDKKTDLALLSDGFFRILTPQGFIYTRCGNFYIDQLCRLVNQDNYPVEGQCGEIIVEDDDFNVAFNGEISISNKKIDKFKIFKLLGNINRINENLFNCTKSTEINISNMDKCLLLQGALEESNLFLMENIVTVLAALEIYKHKKHFKDRLNIAQRL